MTRFDRKAMPTNLVLSYYGLKPLIKTPQRGGGLSVCQIQITC